MALPSASMARKVTTEVPQLAVPAEVIERLDTNPTAGVDLAAELVTEIRDSAAFDGVHLIPVNRYRQVAAELEPVLR